MIRIVAALLFAALLAAAELPRASANDIPSDTEVWSINADGSHLRQLTNDSVADFQPAVSRNGERITWARGSPSQIWEMRLNGSEPHQLTFMPEDSFDPQWSPDGSQIAFISWDSSQCTPGNDYKCAFTNVWVVNADGSNLRLLGPGIHPRWAPSGQQLVFNEFGYEDSGGLVLALVDQSGGSTRILLQADIFYAMGVPPAWAPRGGWIAFTYASDKLYVSVVRATGRHRRRIGVGFAPSWSPDGRRLAFVRPGGVWLSDASGRHKRRLMHLLGRQQIIPVWSPNGMLIAFQGEFGVTVARSVRPARPRTIADGIIDVYDYGFGPYPPSWTRDSRRLVFAERPPQ